MRFDRLRIRKPFLACLVVPFVLAGCGDATLAPTTGTVKVSGELAKSGRVVFRPVSGGATSIGAIESDGSFAMKTNGKDGATIGQSHVLVVDATCESTLDDEVSWRGSEKNQVVIKADTDNQFSIDITTENGWSVIDG